MKLEDHVDFNSQQWNVLKLFLEEQEQIKLSQLIGTDDPNKMYELRGAVKFIRFLLSTEKTARSQAV